MVIDTEISVVLKNYFGEYNVKRISIFDIDNIPKHFKNIKINRCNDIEIEFTVKCPLCDEIHSYIYNIYRFTKGNMCIGGCEKLGIPIFFIGSKEKVEEKINKYKEVIKKIHVMI